MIIKTNWIRALLAWMTLAAVSISAVGARGAAPEADPAVVAGRNEGEFVPVLKTKTVTYTNVTLRAISETDVFLSHRGGVLNVKLVEFDADALAVIESVRANLPKMPAKAEPKPERKKLAMPELPAAWAMDFTVGNQRIRLSAQAVAGIVAGLVLGWLFFCWCCHLICIKSVISPSLLVWLPVVQIFPLLRAAQMPWWWFFAFITPGLNLVAQIVWSMNIVRVRKKSPWLTFFLILPLTSLAGFLYLAFSIGLTADEHRRLDAALKKRRDGVLAASEPIRFKALG